MKFNFMSVFLCASFLIQNSCFCMNEGPGEEQYVPEQCCQQRANHNVNDVLRIMSQNGWNNALLRENRASWLIACRRQQMNQPVTSLSLLCNLTPTLQCCRLHPKEDLLATTFTNDCSICLYNTTNQQVVPMPQCHQSSIIDLAWNTDGTELASISADSLNIWKYTKGELCQIQTIALKTSPRKVSWSPDGSIVAVTWPSQEIKLYAQNGSEIKTINIGNLALKNVHHRYAVTHGPCVAWYPHNILTVGLANGNILGFRRDGSLQVGLGTYNYKSCVISMDWSPDCSRLAVALLNGTLLLFNQWGELIREFKNHDSYFKSIVRLAWNCDGTLLASLSLDGEVCIWNRFGSKIDTMRAQEFGFLKSAAIPCIAQLSLCCKNRIDNFNEKLLGTVLNRITPCLLSWKDCNTLQIVRGGSKKLERCCINIPAKEVLDTFNQLSLAQLILLDHVYFSAIRLQRLRLVNERYCQLYNSLPSVIKEIVTPYVEIVDQHKPDNRSIQ